MLLSSTCDRSDVELLASTREFRHCRESIQAVGKLTFERIEAKFAEHPDFDALTNGGKTSDTSILLLVRRMQN